MRVALLLCLFVGACGGPEGERASAPATQVALLQVEDARLAAVLAGSDDVVARRAAAKALAARTALAPDVLHLVGGALQDPDRWVRESAAITLREQGPAAQAEVGVLIAALKDVDEYVRWRVAEALGRIGPAAAAAREALTTHANDADEVEVVKAASQRALERIGASSGTGSGR